MNHSPDPQADERSRQRTKTADRVVTDYNAPFDAPSDYEITGQEPHDMISDNKRRSLTTYNHMTYLLYVVSYFTAGLLWIVPIVMNYAKRHDADGSWLATHFDWQIKTFWYSVVWFAIGMIIIMFAVGGLGVSMMADSGDLAIGSILVTGFGLLIMVFTFIWHLYRIIRGWIALTDGRPVP